MEDNFEVIENIYQDISTILDNEEYIKDIKRGLNRLTSKELCIKIIFKAYFYLQRMNQSKKINKLFKYLARLDDSTKYFVIYYNQFNKEYNQRKLLKMYIIVLMKEARIKKRSLENLKELLIPCLLMYKSENKNVDKNQIKNNNNSGDFGDEQHKDDKANNNKRMESIANDLHRYIKSIKVKEKDSEIQREFIQTRFTLGDGGTSKVYLGFDVNEQMDDAQMVAIKKFKPEVRERAMEESELLCEKRNKKISNLIAHGIIDEKDTYVQVMDYICGFDLETFLEKKGIPETKAKEIFSKIVLTLYDLGVSHRDLKPANIMLRFDHSVVLIDFTMFSKNDVNKSIVGTPKYIAPEVRYERAYDPEKADVWSLGIILFEMIFGISKMGFDLESLETKNISSSLKSLLRQMLNENFPERISLAEILNSAWLTTEEEVEKLENDIEYIKIMTEKTVQLVKENFSENSQIDFEFLEDSISSISLDPFSPEVFDGNYDLVEEISSDLQHMNDLKLQKHDLLQFSLPSPSSTNEDLLIIKELNLLFEHHLHLIKVIDQNFVIKRDLVLLRFNQLFLFCNIKLGQFFLSIKDFKQDMRDEDSLSRFSKLKKKLSVIKDIFSHLSSVLLYFFDQIN